MFKISMPDLLRDLIYRYQKVIPNLFTGKSNGDKTTTGRWPQCKGVSPPPYDSVSCSLSASWCFCFLSVYGCVEVVSWWSIWVVSCVLGISMESRVVDRPWYHWSSTAGEPDTFSTLWRPILALNPRNRRVWLATDVRVHWWCRWLVPCSCSCSCLVWLVCDSLDHWSSWPLVPRDADSLVEILFLSSDRLGGTL